MYNEEMRQSMAKVEANRKANAATEPRRMTAEEKEKLLATFHPDYIQEQFATLSVGPNKGGKVPLELRELLEANSRVKDMDIDLETPDYDVDVLVIGGGGAGSSAAIEAHEKGANVMIVTKLRIGDANTMMAEGGIQAADKPNDSPAIHYVDALGGGHFANKPELLYRLVSEAPDAIKWLNDLGVEFDKMPDGTMVTTHGGGTSRKRMHAAKDYSGAEIMRTLRDEVLNRQIPVVDFTSAIELILDEEGKAAGAVLQNMETGEIPEETQGEDAENAEDAENTESITVDITASQRLQTAITVLQAISANSVSGQIDSVDVTNLKAIELWYDERFQINLGDTMQLDYKISALKATIDKMEAYESGHLDLSFTNWVDKVGYTPFT